MELASGSSFNDYVFRVSTTGGFTSTGGSTITSAGTIPLTVTQSGTGASSPAFKANNATSTADIAQFQKGGKTYTSVTGSGGVTIANPDNTSINPSSRLSFSAGGIQGCQIYQSGNDMNSDGTALENAGYLRIMAEQIELVRYEASSVAYVVTTATKPNNVSATTITFTDNESVTHDLQWEKEDVTVSLEAFQISFQLTIGGLSTYGIAIGTYDGTNWSIHPILYGVQHEHIAYSLVNNDGKIALVLTGSGTGDAATFKYKLAKPFGLV
jgi:hypothetical protein